MCNFAKSIVQYFLLYVVSQKYLNKSELFQGAAHKLHDDSCYLPVGHCAYYACHQRIRYIWSDVLDHSFSDLAQLTGAGRGVHEVLNNKIALFIKETQPIGSSDFREFQSKIGQLKKLRTKADYEDEDFLSNDSAKALALSAAIIKILKNYQKKRT